jgi:hypothetical protein
MRILRVSISEGALAPCYRAPQGHNQSQDIFLKVFFPDLWRRSSSKTRHATELEKIKLRISAEITRS